MNYLQERGEKSENSSLGWCQMSGLYSYVSDSGCHSLTVLFEEGVIQSLRYPENYSDMANCNWIFQAPKHHLIKVLIGYSYLVMEYPQNI